MAVLRSVEESNETKIDRRKRPKLIIPLNLGKPDCSSLSDDARESLKEALLESEPAPPAPIDPSIIVIAIRAITGIEAAILAGRFGVSQEQAREAIAPNPMLEQQIAAAGARVIEKHSAIMGRYGDEIVLISLLIAWQAHALTALRAARLEQNQEQPAQSSEPAGRAPEPVPESMAPAQEPVFMRDPRDLFPSES